MRKVHRYGFERMDSWGRRAKHGKRTGERVQHKSACGVWLGVLTIAIPDTAFVNLPAAAQCETCRNRIPKAHHGVGLGHATDEQVTGLETAFLAFARLALDLVELGPTWRHRCYFDADRRVCACGRQSAVLRVHERLRWAGDESMRLALHQLGTEKIAGYTLGQVAAGTLTDADWWQ